MTSTAPKLIGIAAAIAAVLMLTPAALAMGKGSGKPPKDDPPPPADPAIVYEEWNEERDIAVANADGSNRTVILSIPGVFHNTPSWSPEGDFILFVSDFGGVGIHRQEIAPSVPAAVGDPELIVATNSGFGGTIRPMASPVPIPDPDCGFDAIAYADRPLLEDGSLSTEAEIYLAFPDGNGGYQTENLTKTSSLSEFYPTWSPDARSLAFKSCSGSGNERFCDILVADITCDQLGGMPALDPDSVDSLVLGTGSPLDVPGGSITGLSWSNNLAGPDLLAMKFGPPSSPNPDIWIVPVGNPAGAFNLTDDPDVLHVQPSWSPDDSQLILRRAGSGLCGTKGKKATTALVVRNLDGEPFASGCTEDAVIKGGGNLSTPHWWRNHVPAD